MAFTDILSFLQQSYDAVVMCTCLVSLSNIGSPPDGVQLVAVGDLLFRDH